MSERAQVDLGAVKRVQQQIWSKGDFARIAATQALVGEALVEWIDLLPGERVLDVACGSGNTTIAAARRFTEAVGVDYVPALLERGRERAAAERLEIEFVEGDAEDLPFDGETFDVVLSTFGVMFAPDQQRAADELLRVSRPGGRIGLTSWTPEGLIGGGLFRITAEHAPPPPGVPPPSLWGTEEHLQRLFGERITELATERRMMTLRWHSPEHWLGFFREYFGPMQMAFERVGEAGEEALANDLLELMRENNRAGDRALVADAEYLAVRAVKD